MSDPRSYIREKLRGAAATIRDDASDQTLQERLKSAYVNDLSNLEAWYFPYPDAQDEFRAIEDAFTQYGEMVHGAGSVPTTLLTMSNDDARSLADRIVALADRYTA